MAPLTEESLKKRSKTDFVAYLINLQDNLETMRNNLSEKIRGIFQRYYGDCFSSFFFIILISFFNFKKYNIDGKKTQ